MIPSVPDQPFGFAPRQAFVNRMSEAWGDRLKVGSLRQHFYRSQTNRTKAVGRMWLTADVAEGDNTIKVGPPDRVPGAPFWVTVGTEAMYVRDAVPESSTATEVELRVDRADATNLFDDMKGTKRAEHKKGEAVCGGIFPGIYVHAKMMLIDDAFAAIGSANLNRRGHFSDGECNLFAIREELSHGDNWIRDLRKKLWSEVLGVPEEYGDVAFDDPVANLKLFDRKFVTGSRFAPFKAQPFRTDFDVQAAFTASTSKFGGIGFIARSGRRCWRPRSAPRSTPSSTRSSIRPARWCMKFTDLLSELRVELAGGAGQHLLAADGRRQGLLAQIDSAIELHDAAADVGADGGIPPWPQRGAP